MVLVRVKLVLVKTGNGGKEPTPNPSQEGNNPCRPVTRINKMKIPIQSSLQSLTRDFLDFYNICVIVRLSAHDEVCEIVRLRLTTESVVSSFGCFDKGIE